MERLDKILANTGRWSRKEARELVRVGRVAVDGVTAQAADGKYDPAARFEVDGETVSGERLACSCSPMTAPWPTACWPPGTTWTRPTSSGWTGNWMGRTRRPLPQG